MNKFLWFLLLPCFLISCIGDDIVFDTVEEQLRFTMAADSIAVGESFQFEARFTNNIGEVENIVQWSSSDNTVININQAGLANALAVGRSTITASVTLANNLQLTEIIEVTVGGTTSLSEQVVATRSGVIRTTSSYKLEGDFSIEEKDGKLLISIGDNYEASTALPGLYVYLTNNPTTTNNALEIGAVEIFEGAHSYELTDVGLNDYDYLLYYCKPFNVKVGDGEIE